MPKFGLLLFIQFIFLSKCLKLYNNCTQSSECLIGNSTCHEGKCSCLPDFKDINNNCYPIDIESKLGLNCTESSQCTGVGEYCSSFNVCLCLSTYVEVSSTCLPIIFPGNSNCLTSLQCSYTFPGSWCDQNHTCQCPEGSIIKGNTCILANNGIPLIQADNSIISNNFNPDKASFFDKITNFITLKTRSIFSNQQSETNDISGIRPGGRCNSDILCSGYPLAYCETVCKCKENSYNAGSTCIKLATEPQPITGSCPPNQVYSTEAGSCVNRVYPSQNCQYSEQCSAIESGSFCRNNICECVYGMVISNDKTKCVYKDNHCITKGTIWVPELGECKQVIIPGLESCSHSLQCSTAFNGSYCYERKCICPPDNPIPVDGTCGIKCQEGQSFSSITGSCLPNINPGNECTYTSQCHSAFLGTVCNSGICKCGGNKVFTGTNCAYSCPTGYMKGLNNICVPGCTKNQIEYNGECLSYAAPGQECKINAQCTGNSLCGNGICTCRSNMQIVSGICQVIKVFPDQSCSLGEECMGGSTCVDGICICQPGTVNVNNQCIKPILVSPGGNCIQSYYKCINGADCVAGTCICPPDTRLINGKCTKELFAFPGEDCGSGQECTRNSICNHETLKCECINTLKIAIGRSCVDRLRSHPGYPCDNGEICIGGSVCFKGFCKCPGNQIVSDKICVEPRRLMPGNKCTDDDICTGNSECDRKTWMCQCRPHHIAIGGICTKIILAKPGEQCSGQQYRCILNSYCNGDTCICLSGMKLIDDQCRIPVKRQPGSYCGENEECTNLSTCINGRCVCNPPRILKNSKCEMTVDVAAGGVCSIHDKCLGGSNCINGRCLCNTNEYIHGGICVEKVYKNPGEHCDENQICSNGSYCSRSKYCICYQGYVIEDSKCVRKTRSRPGESCKNGERCIDNSTCIKDICTCPKSTILQGNKCIPNRVSKIGESCANGEKCINGSKCQPIAKICACPPGFVNRNEACVPIEGLISKKLSQTSEQFFKPEKIKNSFSFSKNNRETLKRNDFISPGLCNKTSDCDENAKCKNNICVCNQNYVLKNGFCIRIISAVDPPSGGSLGHKCTSSNECHVNNSHCKNGRCLCLPGFKMLGVNQCINGKFGKLSRNEPIKHPEEIKLPFSKRPSLPGGKCIDSKECLNKSFCHQGKCVCPRGMKTIKNHCIDVEMVPPLALCSDGQICTGNSECSVNGICLCPKNHTLYKGFCQTDEQIKNMKNLLGNEVTKKKGLVAIPNLKIMGKISLQEKFEILSSKTKTYGTTTTVAPKTTKKQGSTPKMRKSTKLPFDGIAKSITLEKEEILKILQENNNQTRQTTRPPKETLSTKKSSSKVFQTTKPTKPHTTSTSTVSINTSTKTSKTNSTTTTLVTSTTFSPTTIKTSSTKKLTKTTLKPSTKIISSTIVNQAILTTTTTTKIVPSTTTSPTTEVYDNTINLLTIDNHTNTIPTTPESPPIIKNPINITNIVSSIVKSNEILDNKDIIVTLSPETSTNNSTTKYELIPSTEHQIISLPETTMPKINKTITNNVNITSIVEELLSIKEPFILTTTPNEIEKSLEEDNSKEMEEIKEILPPIQVISPHKSLSNVNFYKIFPNLVSNTHYSSNVNTKPLTIPYSLFQISYPGQFCDESLVFCSSNSKCEQNICQCEENYYLYNNECLSIDKNVICISNDDCPLGAFCFDNECQCEEGMRYSRFVNPGSSCSNGETCIGGSICKKNICVCPPNKPIIINNICSKKTKNYSVDENFTINDEYFDIESNIDNSFITQPIEESLLECPHDGSCSLPDCFCSITGLNIPGNIQYNETPQMILLTFDGPITDNVINIYKNIFSGKHKNKNGCPIKGTFFISHEFNNYDQTQWLYSRGHEIGVNSITHRSLSDLSEEEWKDEMVGLREALKKFSYIDSRKIKGLRAPQFALGGEGQFSMMEKENFIYDNTQTTYDGPYWPQTLHFKTPWRCIGQVCPNTSHDIWEFPINMLTRDDGKQALFMLQAVTRFDSSDQIANMLLRNMEKNLNSNKAPFILNIESDFLTAIPYNGALRALDIFITKALQRNDTYFVTMEEALTWIQRPTRLSKLQNFFPWQCRRYKNEYQRPCETPSICSYTDGPTNYPHSFRVCGSCPHVYPWLKNPTGKGNTFF